MNILEIDKKIKAKFEEEKSTLPEFQKRLHILTSLVESASLKCTAFLSEMIKETEKIIFDITNQITYNFYLTDSFELLSKYVSALNVPIKVSFLKPTKIVPSSEVLEIEKKYFEILKQYNLAYFMTPSSNTTNNSATEAISVRCSNCGNTESFVIMDTIYYICTECSFQMEVPITMTSHSDYNRLNFSYKYTYDRRIHFRECINQFQGIQNCTVEQAVYDDLIQQFQRHGLLNNSTSTQEEKFSKITKQHISLFLKELGYIKHYENTILIFNKLTGKKINNISHLVDKLIADFDIFIEAYDFCVKDKVERKSFINIQYVLCQLLLKHKYPCNKNDFNFLKTDERQKFHDAITSEVFTHLGWTFTPLY